MKVRKVIYTPASREDMFEINSWLEDVAGEAIASQYINGIRAYCEGLSIGSMRGTVRKSGADGLRVISYKKRVSIAFCVKEHHVEILRIYYSGKNWQAEAEE